jgi:predicted GIY-YIG superfamily endonuclease
VYLIESDEQPPRWYIGASPDPRRRLRKHNGELPNGALETMQGRPWRLRGYVAGFSDKKDATKFEYKAQHARPGVVIGPSFLNQVRSQREVVKFLWPLRMAQWRMDRQLEVRVVGRDEDAQVWSDAAGYSVARAIKVEHDCK